MYNSTPKRKKIKIQQWKYHSTIPLKFVATINSDGTTFVIKDGVSKLLMTKLTPSLKFQKDSPKKKKKSLENDV